jgi:hypothetical protein
MDAHHIYPVSDLAAPALAHGASVGLAPVGAAVCAAAGLIATCQHGAAYTAADAQRKRLATLQAMLARKGFELHPSATGIYVVARWNLARTLATLDDVQGFAQQVGVHL